jgi:hypothetical protein
LILRDCLTGNRQNVAPNIVEFQPAQSFGPVARCGFHDGNDGISHQPHNTRRSITQNIQPPKSFKIDRTVIMIPGIDSLFLLAPPSIQLCKQ